MCYEMPFRTRFQARSRSRTIASSSSELIGLLVTRSRASPCISRTAEEVSPVTSTAFTPGPEQLACRSDHLRPGSIAIEMIIGD